VLAFLLVAAIGKYVEVMAAWDQAWPSAGPLELALF